MCFWKVLCNVIHYSWIHPLLTRELGNLDLTLILTIWFCPFSGSWVSRTFGKSCARKSFLTSYCLGHLAVGNSVNLWLFFSPGEFICYLFIIVWAVTINHVSICLPNVMGAWKTHICCIEISLFCHTLNRIEINKYGLCCVYCFWAVVIYPWRSELVKNMTKKRGRGLCFLAYYAFSRKVFWTK